MLVHAAAGGVGSLLVQLIRNKGAKVIATVGSDEKGAFVKELGADFVINYSKEDFLEKTLEFTHGVGVHAALDSVGKTTFEKSVAALRPLGVAVIYGSASGPSDPVNYSLLFKECVVSSNSLYCSTLLLVFLIKVLQSKDVVCSTI